MLASKTELSLVQIFKERRLRYTQVRKTIIQLLEQERRPLSHADIMSRSETTNYDRVTIYRTLDSLEKASLVHKILGPDGIWRFCFHKYDPDKKCGGNHIHFMCESCNTMICLPEQPLPWIEAPTGGIIYSKQLVVMGLCAQCFTKREESK